MHIFLALQNCVAFFGFFIADNANDSHAVELPEGVCHVSLLLEHLFAEVAPSLEVVWIIAVLYKTGRTRLRLQHMFADDCRDSFSMRVAVDHHRFSCCHGSCEAYRQVNGRPRGDGEAMPSISVPVERQVRLVREALADEPKPAVPC